MATAACPLVFDPTAHVYRLKGFVVPSVTQVLRQTRYVRLVEDIVEKAERRELTWVEALTQMEKRLRILEIARDRGSRVHNALHFMVEGDLDDDTIDDEVRGYLLSGQRYIEKNIRQVYRAEFRVWSSTHIFAGTLDLFALHTDGFLSVDDAKTGSPDDVAADLQTAAYVGAVLEMSKDDQELAAILRTTKQPIVRRRSLRLFKDGRIARESLYTDSRDYTKFLNALSVVHDQERRPVPMLAWDDER